MDTKCGGFAVRRPLQPRDNNVAVAPSTVVIGKAPKPKPRATGRPAAAEKLRARVHSAEAMVGAPEVSLAEELERARERRGRLRAAREVTQRDMDARAAALDREAAEWERRAEEQSRLVAELMRLIGMPEVSPSVCQPGTLFFIFGENTLLRCCLLGDSEGEEFRFGRCILRWSH